MYSALIDAINFIVQPTEELIGIVLLTLKVSGIAALLATIVGLPLGSVLAFNKVPLRRIVIAMLNAFMGIPPVVVGLFLYVFLSVKGPLGFMGLIYSQPAMIAAQFMLALPIVAAITHSSIISVSPTVHLAARTLGASQRQARIAVINEARNGILSSVIAGFSRALSEVGAILIIGGNIAGSTRVMNTAIAAETSKGELGLMLALGIILFLVSMAINLLLYIVKGRPTS